MAGDCQTHVQCSCDPVTQLETYVVTLNHNSAVQANINLSFLYFLMATATCCAAPPLACAITWSRTSKIAAITGNAFLNSIHLTLCEKAGGAIRMHPAAISSVTQS